MNQRPLLLLMMALGVARGLFVAPVARRCRRGLVALPSTLDPPPERARSSKKPFLGRRQRTPTIAPLLDEGADREPRQAKRRLALLIGYNGKAYYGLQKQGGSGAHLPSIERELERAFGEAGCVLGLWAQRRKNLVSEANRDDLSKIGWSRSARTDKHVSAARTVVSAKLVIPGEDDVEGMVDAINTHLPGDIRIFDAVRVNKNFNCKNAIDKRRYTYLLPAIMVAPDDVVRAAFAEAGFGENVVAESRRRIVEGGNQQKGDGRAAPASVDWGVPPKAQAEVAAALARWRVDGDTLHRLRTLLAAFKGTRRYHNFTAKMKSNDVKAKRFVVSFIADDPFATAGDDAAQWLRLEVVGQSFILHQIRKMIAVATEAAHRVPAFLPDEDAATQLLDGLCKEGFDFPLHLVPGNGLYLGEPIFDTYNQFKADPPAKPRLEWHPDHPKYAKIEAFRKEKIEQTIIQDGDSAALLPWVDYLWTKIIFGCPLSPAEGTIFGNRPTTQQPGVEDDDDDDAVDED